MTTSAARRRLESSVLAALVVAACTAVPAAAQPFGTFTWQLQPLCNRVTVSITHDGSAYTLDGFDDQCGDPKRAPLVGTAVVNPDGSVGLGLAIVTAGGRSVHVDAQVSAATGSGTWHDSEGNSGTFALGANSGGAARREPTGAPNAGTYIDVSAATLSGPYGFGVIVTGATPSAGAAIMARWGDTPTTMPSTPAAVQGASRTDTGVIGISESSIGVIGYSATFAGVGGQGVSGPGVLGASQTGPGVLAMSSGSGPGLEVQGALKVSGFVRSAFLHTATVGNITGNYTVLDSPLLNNTPSAMVFVTPNYGSSFVYLPSPIGVFYAGGTWRIFRQDLAAMPVNAQFNVLVINQ